MLDKEDILNLDGVESVDTFNSSDSGFKDVYACVVDGHKNAVKVTKVADRSGLNDTGLLRLRREIELLSTLHSPYLPTLGRLPVQRVDKDGSTYIIYSEEFIDGFDVNELISNSFFNRPEMVVQLIHDVATAIKIYWEHERTVHRDVKPANIRYSTSAEKFILIDAGIALVRDRTTITPSGNGSPMTPLYAAPEVIRSDRNISYKTDLFCLGVVAYEAATGDHPFYNGVMNPRQLRDAILTLEPASVDTLRGDMPANVAPTIMKMLKKRPHQRPNNISDIINIGVI